MKIEELNLSVRAYNCLMRAGVDTVEKLRSLSDEELMRVRNLGKTCFDEIKLALSKCSPAKRYIDPSDDEFGTILNCAVRYACGRRTYMPRLVIDFIAPLLPSLSSKALWCFDQDLTNAKHECGYGDPKIDEPAWLDFHAKVRAERTRRGEELYKDWRESNE